MQAAVSVSGASFVNGGGKEAYEQFHVMGGRQEVSP